MIRTFPQVCQTSNPRPDYSGAAHTWGAKHRLSALAASLLICLSSGASATQDCDSAARMAAARTGVPLPVLWAITRSETGRQKAGRLRPWPWTVNMEGVGKWFGTRELALSYIEKHRATGARNFDVGCFQINYRWHGVHFADMAEMLDPQTNALYAANFLKKLHKDKENWLDAAGAYHSRTDKHALKYRKRFAQILKAFSSPDTKPRPQLGNRAAKAADPHPRLAMAETRANTYPLLQATDRTAHFGSLVPLPSATTQDRGFFANATGGGQE